MKIGCYFDDYHPFHETKDPGQIVLGFLDLGIQVEMITESKPQLEHYNAPFPMRFITQEQARDVQYWRTVSYDVIVSYTWLSSRYLPVIAAMKKAGKLVLAKGDTDGRLSFPVNSRRFYYTSSTRWKGWLKAAIRLLPDSLRDVLLKSIGRKTAGWLIEHIALADKVIVESPQAQANLSYIVLHWGKPELIEKIYVVSNPVAIANIDSSIPLKRKQIIAVGRWDDTQPKNTATMVKTLCRLSALRPEYEVVIIGTGKDVVQRLIAQVSLRQPIRLHLTGPLPHSEVADHLGRSQILFMPSLWEGFSIAAAEAVCMGCTIVGSPLESLHFLTQGGFSGSLASDFTEDALLSALLSDTYKWDNGVYAPEELSHFWRSRLHRKVIAERLLHLAK